MLGEEESAPNVGGALGVCRQGEGVAKSMKGQRSLYKQGQGQPRLTLQLLLLLARAPLRLR